MSPARLLSLLGLLLSPSAAVGRSDAAGGSAGGAVDLANLTDTIQSLFGDSVQEPPGDLTKTRSALPSLPTPPAASAGDSVISAAVAAGERILKTKAAVVPAKTAASTAAVAKTEALESMDSFLGVAPQADEALPSVAAVATTALVERNAKDASEEKVKDAEAKRAAERKAREEAEKKAVAVKMAIERRKKEAEKRARTMAEKEVAEKKKRAELKAAAKLKAKMEAAQKAKELAEKHAKEEAAKREAKRKAVAKLAAEKKLRQEAEEKAAKEKKVAEEKATEEAEKKAREFAEKKAQQEAEKRIEEEAAEKAAQKAKEEAEKMLAKKMAAEKKVLEERAKRKAENEAEEAKREAKEEAYRVAKADAERKKALQNAKYVQIQREKVLEAEEAMLKAEEPDNVPKVVSTPGREGRTEEASSKAESIVVTEAAQPRGEPHKAAHFSLASFYASEAGPQHSKSHRQRRLDISGGEMLSAQEKQRVSGFTLFGIRPVTPPAPTQEKPKKVALVKASLHLRKQDYKSTALATIEDSMYDIAITDPWTEQEKEDSAEVIRVKREDDAARLEAKVVAKPRESTQQEKETRGGVHISKLWNELVQEDEDIEGSLQGTEDLGQYDRLSRMQDASMHKLSKELENSEARRKAPHVGLRHTDKLNLKIHDRWVSLERKDKEVEDRIRRNPDLKMIQISQALVRPHGL